MAMHSGSPGSASGVCLPAALHPREDERLHELHSLNIIDTAPEERFDRITALVSEIFNVPAVLVTLIDKDRQWFKSACGVDQSETPRDIAFCAHALHQPEILVVPDTHKDQRFVNNPLVTGEPHIRFYAGAIIQAPGELPLGTLCLIDMKPRTLSESEQQRLISFAKIVESEIAQDIGDAQDRAKSQLAANIDPITGFFSYQEFKLRSEQFGANLMASTDDFKHARSFAVVLELPQLDIIRRHYGLILGDEVVAVVAKRLNKIFSKYTAIFGRQYRSSFIVFLPEITKTADELGKLIEKEFAVSMALPQEVLRLNIHIGISPGVEDIERTLAQCHFSLEQISDETGVACRSFSRNDGLELERSATVNVKLTEAIKSDQLELYYQPKVDTQTLQLVGLEALLRWNDPDVAPITPPEIFQAAAAANLVATLDDWVIRTACQHIDDWKQSGYKIIPVSVNISGESLKDVHLPERLRKILVQTKVDPASLHIEILETSVIADFDKIVPMLLEINKMGVSFSLDDFGTGYSSLRYLQRLPIHTVKIDRSFVKEIVENKEDAVLASGIISLAHSLKLEVVAEGVETEEQYAILKSFYCDAIQGFLFCRPVPHSEITSFVQHDHCFLKPA